MAFAIREDCIGQVADGISLRVVPYIGGQSKLRMLERYAHPSAAEMSRAFRVLTAYAANGTKTGTATKSIRTLRRSVVG